MTNYISKNKHYAVKVVAGDFISARLEGKISGTQPVGLLIFVY